MKATSLVSALLSALTILYAPAAFTQSLGEQLYNESCQNCHGPDKVGLSGYAGDFAAFTDRMNGVTEEMPDFSGFFADDELTALYKYLTATDD